MATSAEELEKAIASAKDEDENSKSFASFSRRTSDRVFGIPWQELGLTLEASLGEPGPQPRLALRFRFFRKRKKLQKLQG